MSPTAKKTLKFVLPPAVLVLAVLALIVAFNIKPEAEKSPPRQILPKVEFFEVTSQPIQTKVRSQGTIEAQARSTLTAKVSGLITYISPSLLEGATFAEGDILLRVDSISYQAALAEARAAVERTGLALLQEQANVEQAKMDWEDFRRDETPNPLVLRQPQLAKAEADLAAAEAQLQLAEQNLAYTEIRAPYAGRVITKLVDLGQAVTAQATQLATIYSLGTAEVMLPVQLADMAFLGVWEEFTASTSSTFPQLPVTISARLGGQTLQWSGTVQRTAAVLDRQTRMGFLVAVLDQSMADSPALQPGLFVTAEIQGKLLTNAFAVPRAALQPDLSAFLITSDNRLQRIHPEIVKVDDDSVIIESGISEGDRLCVTPLLFFIDGMEVEPTASVQSNR